MRVGGPKDPGSVQQSQGDMSLADLRQAGIALLKAAQAGEIDVSHLIGVQREAVAPLAEPIQRAAIQALSNRTGDS